MEINMDDILEHFGDVLDSDWVLLFPDVLEGLKYDSDGDVEMKDDFGDDGRGNGLQTPTKSCEKDEHDFLPDKVTGRGVTTDDF